MKLKEYRTDRPKATSILTLANGQLTSRPPRPPTTSSSSTTSPSPSSTLHPSILLLSTLRRFLSSLFLPIGYPASVTPDYFTFQCYDTIQATSSYLRGILCTQAILEGYGVGDATASAASATLTSMVRDGVSMLGGIVFAWCGAAAFGVRVKQFRLFADVINDVGMTIELLSPLFPGHFLLLACVGSLCRTLCGIAAGATRAALMAHFALARNISDISAKEGIQETAVSVLGLIAGWQVVERLKGDLRLTWLTFALLTAVHVWANLLAMRSLILTSLTRTRADLAIDHFITTHHTPTPHTIAALEPILPPLTCHHPPPVHLGVRIDPHTPGDLQAALNAYREVPYGTGFMLVREGRGVRVVLERGVDERTMFAGLFHGRLMVRWMEEGEREEEGMYEECYGEGSVMFDLFYSQLQELGWKCEELHLDAGPWRYHLATHKDK